MRTARSPRPADGDLAVRYARVRSLSESLVAPLSDADASVQSMPDASPTKWHLAHTSWFFETFVLRSFATGYRVFDPRFDHLLYSYYDAVGTRVDRGLRGVLSRPSLDEVHAYRAHVDEQMRAVRVH